MSKFFLSAISRRRGQSLTLQVTLVIAITIAIACNARASHEIDRADSFFLYGRKMSEAGKYDSAANFFRSAAGLYANTDSLTSYVNSLSRVAKSLMDAQRKDSANAAYIEAIRISEQVLPQPHALTAKLYNQAGNFYVRQFEVDKGLSFLEKSLELRKEIFGPNHPDVAGSAINIAIAFNTKKEFDNAIQFYQHALSILSKQKAQDLRRIAIVNNNMGNTYANQEAYEKAISHGKASLQAFLTRYGPEHYYTFAAEKTLADHYLSSGQLENAAYHFKHALPVGLNILGAHHRDIASAYTGVGDYYHASGNLGESINYYHQALASFFPELESDNTNSNPKVSNFYSDPWIIVALRKKASSQMELAMSTVLTTDWIQAFHTYLVTDSCIDLLRRNIHTENARLMLSPILHEVNIYEDAIGTAYELYRRTENEAYLNQAFRFSEKSKAIVLMESLQASNALNYAGVPDSLIAKEQSLRTSIEELNGTIQKELKENTIRTLKDSLLTLKIQYDAFLLDFKTKFPSYYDIRFDAAVADVNDVQEQLLSDHQQMISYFVGNEFLYAFTISKTAASIHRTKSIDTLQQMINQFHALSSTPITTSAQLKSTRTAVAASGHLLYKMLILHSLPHLTRNQQGIFEVIIIPDALLSYLPFEALLTAAVAPDIGMKSTLPYAIYDYEFQYSNSASLLLNAPTELRQQSQQAVAFGLDFMDSQINGNDNDSIVASIPPLRYAKPEAERIAQLTGAALFINDQATKSNFYQYANNAQFIHLATHAYLNDESPNLSYLLFSNSNNPEAFEQLRLYEVYGMHLNAELAVLSACNTGDGKLVKGEGIISLSRAFLYAGCQNIVMSLWSANDESTSLLMELFYMNLRSGMAVHQSIRDAKLSYLNQFPDKLPHYWAPFISIGKSSNVNFMTRSHTKLKLLIGFVVLVLTIWLFVQKSTTSVN